MCHTFGNTSGIAALVRELDRCYQIIGAKVLFVFPWFFNIGNTSIIVVASAPKSATACIVASMRYSEALVVLICIAIPPFFSVILVHATLGCIVHCALVRTTVHRIVCTPFPTKANTNIEHATTSTIRPARQKVAVKYMAPPNQKTKTSDLLSENGFCWERKANVIDK